MSLLAVSVFLSESILTSIDGHFELFFGFLKNNYTYLETSLAGGIMVQDNVTGLIWENKTDDDSIHDKDNTYNWYDAQDVFITTLNSQNFGGYSDWRLPTVKELISIVNRATYKEVVKFLVEIG